MTLARNLAPPRWKRLWTASAVEFDGPIEPGRLIDALSRLDEGFGEVASGKARIRVDTRADGFKLVRLRRFLWSGPTSDAVFDATFRANGTGGLVGEVRLPYPQLAILTLMIGLGVGLAAFANLLPPLFIWAIPGFVILIASRIDLERKVHDFTVRLQDAARQLGDDPSPAERRLDPGRRENPLFPNRAEAALYLFGIMCFCGGFLLISFADIWKRPYSNQHPLDSYGAVALAVLLAGFVTLPIADWRLRRRLDETSPSSVTTALRSGSPATVRAAAVTLGLPGIATTIAVFAILAVGMVSFFGHALLRWR